VLSKGYCAVDACDKLIPYLLNLLLGGIVTATAITANSLVSFRTVEPMDKGFTVGCMATLMSIFAFIPYPIIFGSIVESTCLVWEKKCGKTGNCWFYDNDKFRYYLHGAAIIFVTIGSFFDFLLIFFSDRIKDFYGEKEEEERRREEAERRKEDFEMMDAGTSVIDKPERAR